MHCNESLGIIIIIILNTIDFHMCKNNNNDDIFTA